MAAQPKSQKKAPAPEGLGRSPAESSEGSKLHPKFLALTVQVIIWSRCLGSGTQVRSRTGWPVFRHQLSRAHPQPSLALQSPHPASLWNYQHPPWRSFLAPTNQSPFTGACQPRPVLAPVPCAFLNTVLSGSASVQLAQGAWTALISTAGLVLQFLPQPGAPSPAASAALPSPHQPQITLSFPTWDPFHPVSGLLCTVLQLSCLRTDRASSGSWPALSTAPPHKEWFPSTPSHGFCGGLAIAG